MLCNRCQLRRLTKPDIKARSTPVLPMPSITILLCTYNGAAHLEEQLASFRAQRQVDWDLWVSDDGSQDDTWAILETFAAAERDRRTVRLVRGPQRGVAANYLSLLCHPDLPAGPVALSDQDDVWAPDKLALAQAGLRRGGPVTLYGAQYHFADAALRPIGASRPPQRPAGFANALTQNLVSGHTAALSAGALDLVRRAGVKGDVPYHDWWLYQLVTGAGGDVVIDPARVLLYRQHDDNLLGAHRGLGASLRRAQLVLGRTYGAWVRDNLAALRRAEALLSPGNRALLARLETIPPHAGLRRPAALWRAGLYRQTRLTTAAFYLAAALGRV